MRHRGNSAGATGRIRDRERGLGVSLTKCIKNLCFSTITKKPKATRAVVYTKHGDIASLANRFLTRRETRQRGAQGGAGERAACKKRVRGERGLPPAEIYRQELESRTHGRGRRRVPVLAVRGGAGGREPRVSACPGPWRLALRASARKGVLGGDRETGGANWPQREGGDCSLESAVENWRSPLGAPLLLASGRPVQMHMGPEKGRRGDPGVWLSSSGATRLLFFPGPRQPRGARWEGRSRWRSRRDGEGGAGERSAGRGGRRTRTRRRALGRGAGCSQVLATLQLAGFLSVGGGRHTDVHHVVPGGLVMGCAVGDLLL